MVYEGQHGVTRPSSVRYHGTADRDGRSRLTSSSPSAPAFRSDKVAVCGPADNDENGLCIVPRSSLLSRLLSHASMLDAGPGSF